MMKKLLTYFLMFTVTVICAQNVGKTVVASSGGTVTNAEVTVGYTIGEPIVGPVGSDTRIDQGFWAGGELIVEPINDGEEDLSGILVYPNPVESELTIFTNNKEIYGITLFAVNGKRVLKQKVDSIQLEYKIDMSYLAKGMYVLRLFVEGDNKGKLFKIIKK